MVERTDALSPEVRIAYYFSATLNHSLRIVLSVNLLKILSKNSADLKQMCPSKQGFGRRQACGKSLCVPPDSVVSLKLL